jgi:hypothetical protein
MIEFWFGHGATLTDALVLSGMILSGVVGLVWYGCWLGWR